MKTVRDGEWRHFRLSALTVTETAASFTATNIRGVICPIFLILLVQTACPFTVNWSKYQRMAASVFQCRSHFGVLKVRSLLQFDTLESAQYTERTIHIAASTAENE